MFIFEEDNDLYYIIITIFMGWQSSFLKDIEVEEWFNMEVANCVLWVLYGTGTELSILEWGSTGMESNFNRMA